MDVYVRLINDPVNDMNVLLSGLVNDLDKVITLSFQLDASCALLQSTHLTNSSHNNTKIIRITNCNNDVCY